MKSALSNHSLHSQDNNNSPQELQSPDLQEKRQSDNPRLLTHDFNTNQQSMDKSREDITADNPDHSRPYQAEGTEGEDFLELEKQIAAQIQEN